jgi:hypothetical protein
MTATWLQPLVRERHLGHSLGDAGDEWKQDEQCHAQYNTKQGDHDTPYHIVVLTNKMPCSPVFQ